MAFSENGYYMATTADDNTVRLWDLRMKKILNFKTLEYDEGFHPRAVAFDYSGTYLATAGKDIRYGCRLGVCSSSLFVMHAVSVRKLSRPPKSMFIAYVQ